MVQCRNLGTVLALICLSFGLSARAADADMMKQLMDRVNALEAKNAELERRANVSQSTNAAVDEAIKKADDTQAAVNVTSSRPIKIGGYLDSSFQYNFNQPKNQNNNLRGFDTDSNGYNLHLAELTFDSLPTKLGEAGFRMDLAFGTDTRLFTAQDRITFAAERTNDFINSDLKQGYIEYIMPIPFLCGDQKGIKCDFGKFVTWAGYETIEGADNINSSRSFLFTYAIPFTHTGTRMTYDVLSSDCNKWTVGAGFYNGWDNLQDQNRGKTTALFSDWTPTKWFEMVNTGMIGVEQTKDNRLAFLTATNAINGGDPTDPTTPGFKELHKGDTLLGQLDGGRTMQLYTSKDKRSRVLLDTTLIFKPFCDDKLILALNGDFATEGGNKWYGAAGYAKYQFAKKWYVGARVEYFNDVDGARTGIRQVLTEGTVTLNYNLTDTLAARLEFRHDHSNKGVFDDGKSGTSGLGGPNLNNPFDRKTQNTVMYSWLYKF